MTRIPYHKVEDIVQYICLASNSRVDISGCDFSNSPSVALCVWEILRVR